MRTTRHDQDAAAVDDLDAALRELGVPFERSSDADLAIRPGRRRVPVTLHSMAVASASSVAAPIRERDAGELARPRRGSHQRRCPALLDAAGWAWLDRRGELALRVGDDYLIRSHVAPRLRSGRDRGRGPIRSRAGVTYLAAALERPDQTPVLRAVRGAPASATSRCQMLALRSSTTDSSTATAGHSSR